MKRTPPFRFALLNSLAILSTLVALSAAQAQDEAAARAALRDPPTDADPVTEDTSEAVVAEERQPAERPLAARAEDMKRRAGEQIDDEPAGRANVLGMYVQEADNGKMRVVEVGAASPAFDAGIKQGDIILSFDGFKADTYRKWSDGIRKIVIDSPDGDSMAVEIDRAGERISLRMRKPESKVAQPRLNVPQPLGQASQGQGQTLVPYANQPNQPNLGYGGVDLLGSGFFGGNLDENLGGTTQRAVAEIFRIGGGSPQPTATGTNHNPGNAASVGNRTGTTQAANNPTAAQSATTGGIGARIGLAGLRNEQTGLLVMLDVGGLPPGNYVVSIDDPGAIAAGQTGDVDQAPTGGAVPRQSNALNANANGTVANPNAVPPGNVTPPGQPSPPIPPPGRRPGLRRATPPSSGRVAPFGAPSSTPQQAPAPAAQPSPQGNHSNVLVPKTVLAQLGSDTTGSAATPAQTPTTGIPAQTPTTGSVQPPQTPATGTTSPSGAVTLGENPTAGGATGTTTDGTTVTPNGTQDGTASVDGVTDTNAGLGTNVGTGTAGGLNQIGTLVVDQNGTGRLQQVVEGMQVADVLGLAIIISGDNPGIDSTFPQAGGTPRDAAFQPRIGGTRRPVPGATDNAGNTTAGNARNPNVGPAANAVDGIPGTHGNFRNDGSVRTDSSTGGLNGPTPVAAGIIRALGNRSATASGTNAVQDTLR